MSIIYCAPIFLLTKDILVSSIPPLAKWQPTSSKTLLRPAVIVLYLVVTKKARSQVSSLEMETCNGGGGTDMTSRTTVTIYKLGSGPLFAFQPSFANTAYKRWYLD